MEHQFMDGHTTSMLVFFPHKYEVAFILFRILRKLQALLILNESLKQQDTDFREQCKVELGKLQKLVRYVC